GMDLPPKEARRRPGSDVLRAAHVARVAVLPGDVDDDRGEAPLEDGAEVRVALAPADLRQRAEFVRDVLAEPEPQPLEPLARQRVPLRGKVDRVSRERIGNGAVDVVG